MIYYYNLLQRINHYEGRLSALFFKKKFPEKMLDIRPKVEGKS